jgi:hypothetical protein
MADSLPLKDEFALEKVKVNDVNKISTKNASATQCEARETNQLTCSRVGPLEWSWSRFPDRCWQS